MYYVEYRDKSGVRRPAYVKGQHLKIMLFRTTRDARSWIEANQSRYKSTLTIETQKARRV